MSATLVDTSDKYLRNLENEGKARLKRLQVHKMIFDSWLETNGMKQGAIPINSSELNSSDEEDSSDDEEYFTSGINEQEKRAKLLHGLTELITTLINMELTLDKVRSNELDQNNKEKLQAFANKAEQCIKGLNIMPWHFLALRTKLQSLPHLIQKKEWDKISEFCPSRNADFEMNIRALQNHIKDELAANAGSTKQEAQQTEVVTSTQYSNFNTAPSILKQKQQTTKLDNEI